MFGPKSIEESDTRDPKILCWPIASLLEETRKMERVFYLMFRGHKF